MGVSESVAVPPSETVTVSEGVGLCTSVVVPLSVEVSVSVGGGVMVGVTDDDKELLHVKDALRVELTAWEALSVIVMVRDPDSC